MILLMQQDWDANAMRNGVEERYTKATIRQQLLEIYELL